MNGLQLFMNAFLILVIFAIFMLWYFDTDKSKKTPPLFHIGDIVRLNGTAGVTVKFAVTEAEPTVAVSVAVVLTETG